MLYTSFKEMKEAQANRPFDKKKYEKYIEDLKKLHRDKKSSKVKLK